MLKTKQFGEWLVCTKTKQIINQENGYWADLEEKYNSGRMLDFIMQVASKNWGTPQCLGNLVKAFEYGFDPQANICSLGANKSFSPYKR